MASSFTCVYYLKFTALLVTQNRNLPLSIRLINARVPRPWTAGCCGTESIPLASKSWGDGAEYCVRVFHGLGAVFKVVF